MTYDHDFDQLDPTTLCPQDERLLDALVECGFDPDALEALSFQDKRRVKALLSLFELIEDYPVQDADDALVDATLARIDQYERRMSVQSAAVDQVDAQEISGRRRIHLPDFVSVAAVILIGASIFWPVMTNLHQRNIDTGCANNLRLMGYAFSRYGNDYDGAMPVASLFASWNSLARNIINLGPLVDGNYCERGDLSCPGHEDANFLGDSYSYLWPVPGRHLIWGGGEVTMLVLADRNRLIDAIYQAEGRISPLSNSLNHGGRGQNALSTDGAWVWLDQPTVGGDNIWLPQGASSLHEGIKQTDAHDVFLAH